MPLHAPSCEHQRPAHSYRYIKFASCRYTAITSLASRLDSRLWSVHAAANHGSTLQEPQGPAVKNRHPSSVPQTSHVLNDRRLAARHTQVASGTVPQLPMAVHEHYRSVQILDTLSALLFACGSSASCGPWTLGFFLLWDALAYSTPLCSFWTPRLPLSAPGACF